MERVILHSDANSFYASVECLYNPAIRDQPVAVTGSVEDRHGIVLTANRLAKRRFGVKVGMAIWQAKQVCPNLVCVPPDYPLYIRFSQAMRDIYADYSNRIEAFGLDEAWIDISAPGRDIAEGERIAKEIGTRIREELGITVSIGVSFNKVFAKLGSDLRKPDAVSVISKENYQQVVWPLPASSLLYVGSSARKRLASYGIHTIGDLAKTESSIMERALGKNGLMLWCFANGVDNSPVMKVDTNAAIKSVGNSTTPPHDIATPEDAKCIFYVLAESVCGRLREQGFRSSCISISARTTSLTSSTRQITLPTPTCVADEVFAAAWQLFCRHYAGGFPYRSVGISCGALSSTELPMQMDLLGREEQRARAENLAYIIDSLRVRFGHQMVRRAVELTDDRYARVNPKEDHMIHPESFYRG